MPKRNWKSAFGFFTLLLAGVVLLYAAVYSAGVSPIQALQIFIQGAFGSKVQWEQTLGKSMPLLFTGLSVAVGLKAGLFNIGAEGQLLVGGLAAAWVGYQLHLPTGVHIIAVLAAGAIIGSLWAYPAAWIKVKRGGHEVITTIMFNYMAIYLGAYLLNGPMQAVSEFKVPKTPVLQKTAWLASLPNADGMVTYGFLIGILFAVGLWYWLSFTPRGYEIRVVGANPDAAEANGISAKKTMMTGMLLSGALAGLAGATLVMSVPEHRFYDGFSPGYGFDGLAVALLAGGHPLGVIPAGILFGGIDAGTRYLESQTSVPRDIATVIRGLVILYVAVIAWRKSK